MMQDVIHAVVYSSVALIMLTWGGNVACQWMLRWVGKTPAKAENRSGYVIGALERLIIAIGLFTQSWEVLAGVVALKSIARFKELDEAEFAEYFLIGSLFSLLWALLISSLWLGYDQRYGFDLRSVATRWSEVSQQPVPVAVQVDVNIGNPKTAPGSPTRDVQTKPGQGRAIIPPDRADGRSAKAR